MNSQLSRCPGGVKLQAAGRTVPEQLRSSIAGARQQQRALKRCAARCAVPGPQSESAASAVDRRQLLLGAASLVAVAGSSGAPAAFAEGGDELVLFSDPVESFKMSVPPGWVFGEGGLDGNKGFSGASGTRRVVGWYKEDDPQTNVTVVLTTIGFDYTGMGSFGTPYDFGSNLVGSMDRSYMLRQKWGKSNPEDIQIAKLVDAKDVSTGGGPKTYYVEYTVVRPGGDKRHLYSVATLGHNGTYNRLYTVTAQTPDTAPNGELLQKVVKSFQPPPLTSFGR